MPVMPQGGQLNSGPLEMLKRVGNFAMEPLLPKEAIEPVQEAIDSPTLERSPGLARIQGFGAGALEGLRNLTSPVELGGLASLAPWGRMAGALGRGAQGLQKAGSTVEILDQAPKMAPLGESVAEFAPMGGEGAYNAAKAGLQRGGDAMGSLYDDLMRRGMGGRQGVPPR